MRHIFMLLALAGVAAAAPKYQSPVITAATPGQSVAVKVDITNATYLYLVVTDAGDGFSCDWGRLGFPSVDRPAGHDSTYGIEVEGGKLELAGGCDQFQRWRNTDDGLRAPGDRNWDACEQLH